MVNGRKGTTISQAAIDYFRQIFTEHHRDRNLDFIRGCDNLITEYDNKKLIDTPSEDEIKFAIESMDPNSCAGPDGFNGHFFQFTWDIIKKEILNKIAGWQGRLLSSGDSIAWKDLLCMRDKMEQHIIWKINSGNSMFWWDNWTRVKTTIKKKFKFIDYTWNWSKVCLMAENFKEIITSSMIYWNMPNGNNWKLNTDGSYMRNQNKVGARGIVRNSIGDMIIAFSYPTQCYTNNCSEAQAALIGISWCLGQQFEALEVELDSQVVVRMINGSCKPPWRIHNLIEDMKNKIARRNIIVKHCYREGNEVADALAKYATTIQ
ncbi:hypothetical protein KY285_003408 [Solanum tuberosum]|nr:hypothetical protein KY285_003408 [Solanum tuberosum]